MNFKKLLFIAAIAPAMALTSCDSTDGPGNNLYSVSLSALNLYTHRGTTEPSTFGPAIYTVQMDLGVHTLQLGCISFPFNGKTYSFSTDPTQCKVTGTEDGYENFYFSCNPTTLTGSSYTLHDFNMVASIRYYWANDSEREIPVIAFENKDLYTRLLGTFMIDNDYQVTLVHRQGFYRGETTTNVGFKTDMMSYRVVMNIGDKPEDYTADVVIYNPKFAEQMPALKPMHLKGLKVEMTHGGYRVYGEDIIPEVVTSTGATPYPNYVFNTFEVIPNGKELADAEINYTVAGRFTGHFTGKYVEI